MPILADWRLREYDFGDLNGAPASQVHAQRLSYLDVPYPAGESWRQATERVRRFLDDLPVRWCGARVLVIGHLATRWGLECALNGASLSELVTAELSWQPGWEYKLPGIFKVFLSAVEGGRLPAPIGPLGEVRAFGPDRGALTVTRQDQGLGR